MTDLLDLVRETALALPEVAEDAEGGSFAVAGVAFVRVVDGALSVRGADGEWVAVEIGEDPVQVEDRIARGWELAAPTALLEAGGR
jgi:phosphoribosylglycinamide formyltransferase-1